LEALEYVNWDTTPNSEDVKLFACGVGDPKPYYSLIIENFSLLGIVQALDHIVVDFSFLHSY